MYSQFSLSTQLVDYLYNVEEKINKPDALEEEFTVNSDRPGDAYESFLKQQLLELQNRVDEANSEYLDILKNFTTTRANVKAVEDEVEVINMRASVLPEGEVDEGAAQAKKELATRLRKGRDALGRASAQKDNQAKVVAELKEEYSQKVALLAEHLARTGSEREEISEEMMRRM